MLTSNIIKAVKNGFPLKIIASDVKVQDVDFNPEFIRRMIPKLEWSAVCEAAESLGHLSDLPCELPGDANENEDFLRKAHHVLLEVEVHEGFLVCPETGRQFPIKNGIPNMLLNENELGKDVAGSS